jgi:ABC-2 type transport system permease protein
MTVLRLLSVFFRIGSLNELAYRANFWVQAVESAVQSSVALGGVAVVFAQTDEIGGWRRAELIVLLGIYFLIAGTIRMVIGPSFSRFMEHVHQGTLDFTLTKPADAQLLVSIEVIQIWKVLDVLVGVGVLSLGLAQLSADVGPANAAAFALALLCALTIVYSFWLVLATLCFWFIRVENILMVFWGVYGAGRWPITIYPQWLRVVLTFLVPIAFAVTVPAQAISGRLDTAALAGAVALAAAMAFGSRRLWKLGLRHYSGASA